MIALPDGPRQPNALQLARWILTPHSFLEDCARRYGDPFTMRLQKNMPYVFFSHPEAIQQIFSADADRFDVGRANAILQPLVGNNSIALLDGEQHQHQRRLLLPPLHGQRVKQYARIIHDVAHDVARQWQPGQRLVARSVMQEIALRVILHAIFGLSEGERYRSIKAAMAQMLAMTASPLRSSALFFGFLQWDLGGITSWGRMVHRRQRVRELLQAEIEERRAQPQRQGNDILSLLLSTQDEDGRPMSDLEIQDEMLTLLFAGHETTANSLAWALYWPHRQPAVLERLRAELDALGPETDLMEVAQLPYLSAVCNEALRLYPAAPMAFGRYLNEPMEIMGHRYEAETLIGISIYLTHRREDLYPQADQFRPERFLERDYSPYEFIPFGGGNRRCVGAALAALEMKLVLAALVQHYEFELAEQCPVRPQRRGVTVAPAGGIKMTVRGRRQQPAPQAVNA